MSARLSRIALLTFVLAMALAMPARGAARGLVGEEIAIGACIKRAAGGRIWLEKTLWGLRDQEAGWIGAEVRNADGSHDLGPLQVNSWWGPRIAAKTRRPLDQIRQWLVNDACFNVEAARWIFLSALSATGDYWQAIGAYHSPTAWRQRRYTADVVIKLKRRFGDDIFTRSRSTPADVGRTLRTAGRGGI